MNQKMKRFACHEIVLADGSRQTLSVVEILSGEVVRWYPLKEELPFTQWLPGSIELRHDHEGALHAYYNNVMIN